MAKKFAEHNGLNLTQTNNDVLAAWEKNDIFHKSIDEREGCPPASTRSRVRCSGLQPYQKPSCPKHHPH